MRQYIGQAHGPFVLPCHMEPGYHPDADPAPFGQCAGAAIFRSNIGVAGRFSKVGLQVLPAGPAAFANEAEMVAHHLHVPLAEAEALLRLMTPAMLLKKELADAGVRVVGEGAIACAPR